MKMSVERICQAKGIASVEANTVGSLTCARTNKWSGVSGSRVREGERVEDEVKR